MQGAIPRRSLGIIATSLATLIAVGIWLENTERFEEAAAVLRESTVPSHMLRYGAMGEILHKEGYVESEWNDGRYERTTGDDPPSTASVFRKKRQVGDILLRASTTGSPASEPIELDPDLILPCWPTLVLEVDHRDLYDPDIGIVVNYEETWEKPARVAFFVDEDKLFEADCGVRLHGDTTRRADVMTTRGHVWRSFRLYFRSDYGPDHIPAGLMFDAEAGPLRNLVVRGNNFFCCSLAYSVARKLGVAAPEIRLISLVLNGERVQPYVATEHLSRRQATARLGHEDFLYCRVRRSDNDKQAQERFDDVGRWLETRDETVTAEEVDEHIDLENFMRHMFAILHGGSSDWGEGVAILNLREDRPRWRWTMWDMDNAYRPPVEKMRMGLSPEEWDLRFIDHALFAPRKARGYLRSQLFLHLMETDWFLPRFARLSQNLLNHEIPPAYLNDLVDEYLRLSDIWGPEQIPIRQVRPLIDAKPAVVRADLQNRLNLKPAQAVWVRKAERGSLTVDGYEYTTSYSGWHFPEFGVHVEIPEPESVGFSHWLVNGVRHEGGRLNFEPTEATEVQAIFRD